MAPSHNYTASQQTSERAQREERVGQALTESLVSSSTMELRVAFSCSTASFSLAKSAERLRETRWRAGLEQYSGGEGETGTGISPNFSGLAIIGEE